MLFEIASLVLFFCFHKEIMSWYNSTVEVYLNQAKYILLFNK